MFSSPAYNLTPARIGRGMIVVDVGAGTGLYARALSTLVGPDGCVYAVDVQKDLVLKLQRELEQDSIRNVRCVWGNVETKGGLLLKDQSVDRVIVANTAFQFEQDHDAFTEMHRILKPHGLLVIIDWKESFSGIGPHKDHIFSREDAVSLCESHGFVFVEEFDAGDHHYGIVLKKI